MSEEVESEDDEVEFLDEEDEYNLVLAQNRRLVAFVALLMQELATTRTFNLMQAANGVTH